MADTTIANDDLLLTPADESDGQTDSEAVRNYLEGRKKAEEAQMKAEAEKVKAEEEKTKAAEEKDPTAVNPAIQQDANGNVNIHLQADKSLATPIQEDMLKKAFVVVDETQIPVTDEDKKVYLKAVLHDKPIIMDVALGTGFTARCRSLTAYESEVVFLAGADYAKKYANGLVEAGFIAVQGARIIMQVTHVNGTPRDYTRLGMDEDVEPSREEDVQRVMKEMRKALRTWGTFHYGLLIRCVNIFEHKMNRCNEMALNRDFWAPGD